MDTFLMTTDYDLISARYHFLTTDVVVDFCRYFADYLSGKPFDPPYLTQTHRPKCQYVFTSMEDAWGQYALESSNQDSYDRLCRYQAPLREAVSNRDDARTLELIDRIFSDKLIAAKNRPVGARAVKSAEKNQIELLKAKLAAQGKTLEDIINSL